MDKLKTCFLVAATAAVSFAGPQIGENVSISSDGSRVFIDYVLSGAPAIVTLDVETNSLPNAAGEWVSVGGENIQTFAAGSAVNRIVRGNGAKRITWHARKDLPAQSFPNGLRARMKAWALNQPPHLARRRARQGERRPLLRRQVVPAAGVLQPTLQAKASPDAQDPSCRRRLAHGAVRVGGAIQR